jgi:hypothetical protein
MNPFNQERIDYAKYHKTAEKQLLPLFRKALYETIKPIIDVVNTIGLSSVTPEMINRNVWQKTYQNAYNLIGMKIAKREFYTQRRLDGGLEEKSSAIDFLADVWDSILRNAANNYVLNIQNDLNDTTMKIIRDALGEAYELGLDEDGTVRLFLKIMTDKQKERAKNFSRTEATTLSNLGKEIGAKSWIEQNGGKGYKMWLGRNDARERPSHLAENNTILEIDDLYDLDGELAQRPGDVNLSPNNRINCRCTQSIMSQNRYNAYVKRGLIKYGKVIG